MGDRPKIPKRVRVVGYTATLKPSEGHAVWDITHERKLVGRMYDGHAYGWGRPYFSLTKLVWAGIFPEDSSSPKSPNYGTCFDGGPFDSYQTCLKEFAKRADRLIQWRKENTK